MARILKCFHFQTKNMIKSALIFTLSYIAVCLGIISITMISDEVRISSFSSGLYIGALIFVFVYSAAGYRATFNYLLIHGNTRKTILISTTAANTVLSVIMVILASLSMAFDSLVTKLAGGTEELKISLIGIMYPDSSTVSSILFMVTLYIMVTAFSTLYGSLAYKLGKVFIIVFWVCFGLSFIVVPMSGGSDGSFSLLNLINGFLCLQKPNGIWLASINFIIAALLCSAAAYLISSRQPQTAPVP
jgi:hypothetical protein